MAGNGEQPRQFRSSSLIYSEKHCVGGANRDHYVFVFASDSPDRRRQRRAGNKSSLTEVAFIFADFTAVPNGVKFSTLMSGSGRLDW